MNLIQDAEKMVVLLIQHIENANKLGELEKLMLTAEQTYTDVSSLSNQIRTILTK